MARFVTTLSSISKFTALLIVASLLTVAGLFHYRVAKALRVDPRSMKINDVTAGAHNVTYELTMGIETPGTLGSVRIQFCSNTSLVNDVCDPPFGFDALNVNISSQSGETGFSRHPTMSSVNEIVLSRAPVMANAGISVYTLSNIINPTDEGTMFMRVLTYTSSDGSGSYVDAGGLATAFTKELTISAEVPPYLLFCAAEFVSGFNCASAEGDFIDFGTFGADRTAAGTSEMVTGTNADGGYVIRVNGIGLASGINVINSMAGGVSQRGTSQFGMNLRANTSPLVGEEVDGPGAGQPTAAYNVPNQFRFATGEAIASSAAPDDYRKYTASYIVNVPSDQPGGVYATTMTYICLANF
jgi:hypothetical protein